MISKCFFNIFGQTIKIFSLIIIGWVGDTKIEKFIEKNWIFISPT